MSRLELVRPDGTEERGLRLSRDVISTSNCRPACARAAVVAETLALDLVQVWWRFAHILTRRPNDRPKVPAQVVPASLLWRSHESSMQCKSILHKVSQ